jgi:hypothetical protein
MVPKWIFILRPKNQNRMILLDDHGRFYHGKICEAPIRCGWRRKNICLDIQTPCGSAPGKKAKRHLNVFNQAAGSSTAPFFVWADFNLLI